ncbi:alpha-galactosidase [Gordonia neofelifaecis]|uniref:Alpha-galactosidase n=1 Tax=Gordonia neofelifaecis NRRL B-59395 TaxID=644548 RepID=F1YJ71_9ACTN|nr:alpha-galactosidase [Gordonia neofelifaecis]EGD55286.1 alpha-galactosidase [Gordonia neofelifaecis NRRL B-59395]
MRRLLVVIAAVLVAVGVAGCAEDSDQSAPDGAVPNLGWLVRSFGTCAATEQQVRDQAQRLVATGLRDAGYRTVLVDCRGAGQARYRAPADQRFLAGLGIRLSFLGDTTSVVAADMPRVEALRTAVTRHVMEARPLIPSADLATVPAANIATLANREALELLRDPRAAPGAPVHDDREVYSRAIGERGLLVSLTNGSGADRSMSVGVRELGLAGDDLVPARDIWTGRRITAQDGELTIPVRSGDSALLRIG